MSRRRVNALLLAVPFVVLALGACDNGGEQALSGADKVTICHATSSGSNPYSQQTVSIDSIIKENGHDSHPEDVIPSFKYLDGGETKTYPGKNLDGGVSLDDCEPTSPTSPPATAAPPLSTTSTTTTTTTSSSSTTTTTTTETTAPPTTESPIIGPTDAPTTTGPESSTTTGEGETTTTGEGGATTTTISRIPEIPPTTLVPVTDPGGTPVTNPGGEQVTVPAVVATNPDGSTVTDANGDAQVLGIIISNPDGTPVTDPSGALVTLPVQPTLAGTGGESPSLVPAGVFFIALGGFAIALMARLRRLPR
jgi:hypothetical protein